MSTIQSTVLNVKYAVTVAPELVLDHARHRRILRKLASTVTVCSSANNALITMQPRHVVFISGVTSAVRYIGQTVTMFATKVIVKSVMFSMV